MAYILWMALSGALCGKKKCATWLKYYWILLFVAVDDIDGLVQDCSNSGVLVMELL